MRYKIAYLTLQLVESVDEDPISLVQISKLTQAGYESGRTTNVCKS